MRRGAPSWDQSASRSPDRKVHGRDNRKSGVTARPLRKRARSYVQFTAGSIEMTRLGRASSSRSKSSSSTADAPRENTLKLTPSEKTVAPRGELRPLLSAPDAVAENFSITARSRTVLTVYPFPRNRSRTMVASSPSQEFFCNGNDPVGLEAEFSLEFLERS
jgi:hypothetical protein